MTNDTLLILDVSGWIATCIFGAKGGAVNEDGTPIEGPREFFSRIFKLLEREAPGYFVVACDSPRDSLVRKQWYDGYKAKRPEKTEEFALQAKLIYTSMRALNFPLVRIDGWEADDVIASYAHQFSGAMTQTTIASNDKDMHQLLNLENVRILRPDGTLFYRKHAEEKWGVPVNKIRHVQALAGDSTDGIPGAHKIGVKKAAPLILKYGSAKKVKAAANELTPGAKIALQAFDAELNLRLVTVQRDLPISEDLPPWNTPNRSTVQKTLTSFGISGII